MAKERVKTKDLCGAKLWTAPFIKITLASLFVYVSYQMQTATLPLYVQYIGGNRTDAGLMMSVFTLAALLFRPLVGGLCDFRGRKIVLTGGIIIFTLVSLAYNYVYLIGVLFVLRFFQGAGFSALSTAGSTITSDVVPASRLMEGIGYYGLSVTLATTVGPAFGLYLLDVFGYPALFRVTVFFALAGLLIAASMSEEREKPPKAEHALGCQFYFFDKAALWPSLVMLFVAAAQISVIIFLPSYSLSLGLKNAGQFFAVQAITMMLIRPVMGRAADRSGTAIILVPAMAVLLISYLLTAFHFQPEVYLFYAVLNGLGYGTVLPVLNGLTLKSCPQARRGAANSTFYAAIDLGFGAGSLAWGLVSEHWGFPPVYLLAAGSVGFALILLQIQTLKKFSSN